MYSAAGQLISLIHRSNALGSSHGGPISECCSAASSIPRHRPTLKERSLCHDPTSRSANIKRGVEPELAKPKSLS